MDYNNNNNNNNGLFSNNINSNNTSNMNNNFNNANNLNNTINTNNTNTGYTYKYNNDNPSTSMNYDTSSSNPNTNSDFYNILESNIEENTEKKGKGPVNIIVGIIIVILIVVIVILFITLKNKDKETGNEPKKKTIMVGNSFGFDDDFTVTVDDESKVTIENNAITFNEAGTITVTVIDKKKNKTVYEFTVQGKEDTGKEDTPQEVKKTYPNSISVNKTSISLQEGGSTTLSYSLSPGDVTEKEVAWSSGDPSVASVDSNGKVIAIREGNAVISATTENGKTASCLVAVKAKPGAKDVDVTSVAISNTQLTVFKGKTGNLSASVNPSNATNKNIVWTSSNTGVATVDSSGKIIGVSNGTAVITASSVNDKNSSCLVTVRDEVLVSSITINKTSATIVIGKTVTLTTTIKPTNTDDKTVTWTSSNPAIASVNNGVVTGVAKGTATITGTTSNGKKVTCKVTVKTS